MPHQIPVGLLDSLSKPPAPSKITQVSNMQKYIQGLLGDTHHTFLQGSYRNNTAVSDINDVDIVAVRLQTFSGTYSSQPVSSQVYWDTIFSEIEQKLTNQKLYKWSLERDDKCIKIRGAFKADVVPAVQVHQDFMTDPIVVYSFRERLKKLNHPRIHVKNGETKNKNTNETYKPMVRVFKNWVRNNIGDDKDIISSFKMEALVHGVEDGLFVSDKASSFILIGDSINKKLNSRNALPVKIPSVCGREDISSSWSLTGRETFRQKLFESLAYALEAHQAQSSTQAERLWRQAFNM